LNPGQEKQIEKVKLKKVLRAGYWHYKRGEKLCVEVRYEVVYHLFRIQKHPFTI
jgi:hypothetical protein